jgi:hypothetical protein
MSISADLISNRRSRHLCATPTDANEGALPLNNSTPAPVASPATPAAHRLEAAGWVNLRSAFGLLLIFGAVFGGTVVLQRAQHLIPVYAAARDLPSGVPLSTGDLSLVRVRLPSPELERYLRPGVSDSITGKMLTLPLRQHMLIPADDLVASREQANMVELAINIDPGDMLQGLRPGDHVQILGAYSDGLQKGAAQLLVDSAEVVRILEDSGGLASGRRQSGVQVRLPRERTASVAAALAGGRVFVVKAPALPSRAAVPGLVVGDDPPPGAAEGERSGGSR